MTYTRRKFLGHSLLASGSLLVPRFIKALEMPSSLINSANERVLVVLQLSGGNDGLNCIVPYNNDDYYKLRPGIGLKKDSLIAVTDDFAFNKILAPFQKFYDDGMMTIINSVGYPNPNLSHFRSMDIWQSASGSNNYYTTGWLGRYLDATCMSDCSSHAGVEVNGYLSLAMKGAKTNGIATADPRKLINTLREPYLAEMAHANHGYDDDSNVAYLYKVMASTYSSAAYLSEKVKNYNGNQQYPDTVFGRKLKNIASLINARADTRVYYVSISGFDTHANQLHNQGKALTQVANGLESFINDINTAGRINDVMVMVFSEFGRRAAQNASAGTDHGTANNVWLFSGALNKKGMYNAMPELSMLNNGNFKYSIDFRSVYATLLNKWLMADDKQILKDKFKSLDFI